MKPKHKAIVVIIVLAAFVLTSLALTGCDDDERDNGNSPTEINQPAPPLDGFAPPRSNAPQRDPDAPLPERNADGTLG